MKIKLNDALDFIFSSYENINIWDETYILQWSGLAKDIPKKYKKEKHWRIFGTMTENLEESRYINIVLLGNV